MPVGTFGSTFERSLVIIAMPLTAGTPVLGPDILEMKRRPASRPVVQKIALAQVTATCDPLILVAARNQSRGARQVACAVGRNGSRSLLSGSEASDCS